MRRFANFAFGLVLATGVAGAATAGPDEAVKYRHALMEGIGAHATAMGLIAQDKVPHTDAFPAHAEMLAASAALATEAFRENTTGKSREQTHAKPEIWENWGDFEERMKTLETQTREIADLSAQGGVQAAAGKLPDLFNTCKGCHDKYQDD